MNFFHRGYLYDITNFDNVTFTVTMIIVCGVSGDLVRLVGSVDLEDGDAEEEVDVGERGDGGDSGQHQQWLHLLTVHSNLDSTISDTAEM